jgi:hypothetical protein
MARIAALLMAAPLLLLPAAPRAQEKDDTPTGPPAPAGLWKLTLPALRDEERNPPATWLVKVEEKDGKWSGEVLAGSRGWTKASLEKLSVAGGVMRFQLKAQSLTFLCEVRLGKDPKAAKLYGNATVRKEPMPLELERTALTSLDSFDQLKEALAKTPLGYDAVGLALRLLQQAEAKKAKPTEVRAWAEKAVKSAELYGPAWQREVIVFVARILSEEKGYEAIALQYARRAERALEAKEPPAAQKKVLDALRGVLEKAGKDKEAQEIQLRLAKLDFRIKPRPYAGRKAKGDRVVLVELFTGAQCPPCVAADLAFDALDKTYKPSEVVLLQYHVHVPDSDPLSCPESVSRFEFYEEARGTPAILFNGKTAAEGGGDRDDAAEKYEEYVEVIDPLLETPAKASLKLEATRKDGKINITAEVDKLPVTGDEVRLRLALVEEEVGYKGRNGLAVHHHVVRAMPGGADGTVMKEKSAKKTFTVDLAELKKKLGDYLEKHNSKRPFPGKERPMDLKKLKVVAFVQNDRGGEVLQAAQADVPE